MKNFQSKKLMSFPQVILANIAYISDNKDMRIIYIIASFILMVPSLYFLRDEPYVISSIVFLIVSFHCWNLAFKNW